MKDTDKTKIVWIKAIDCSPSELQQIEDIAREYFPEQYVPIVSDESINILSVDEFKDEIDNIVEHRTEDNEE